MLLLPMPNPQSPLLSPYKKPMVMHTVPKPLIKSQKQFFPSACRYKVWYLEICDPVEKKQVVHLILAEGGNNCEIVRHLTKDCTPSKENDHPVMPQKAAFKELLLSKNHSLQALEETIDKTVRF